MRDILHGFGTGFTIAAAILLFLLTALLAGGLAYEAWTWASPYGNARENIGWPIAIFAFSSICIACCVRTRNPFLRVACVLGLGGGLVLLVVVAGIWFQY